MRGLLRLTMVWLLCAAGLPALAGHTQARLVLGAESARAGDTVLAGVHLRMDPRWHTYWKNPGASGSATTITWQLPPGVTAGATEWPMPEKSPDKDLTTYIYENEVVLLVPLKLAPNLPAGPIALKAKAAWLECEMQCVFGGANLEATLNVGAESKASPDAAWLASWEKKVPRPDDAIAARAWWEKPASADLRPLLLEWKTAAPAVEPDFFPDAGANYEVQPDTEKLPADGGKARLRKEVKKFNGDWPQRISGVLVQQSGDERLAWQVNLPIGSAEAAAAPTPSGESSTPAPEPAPTPHFAVVAFLAKLGSAFLGGLILNVMPCVLPVIALKIFAFVSQAKEDPRRVRKLGLIYALGVLVSFLVLAGLVIGVQAAGHQAGWAMQFANPQFLVLLTVLVTLIALNLFGIFDINPGGRVLGTAGALASKHGAAGAFFNGMLATILGTSCTAPYLAGAVGFAFTQPPVVLALIFAVAGLGLAFPYVVLSWNPVWTKFLPKPGRWMERFKIALGFPMLATAVWLFGLLPAHYGKRTWWLGIFLVIAALAAWVYGEFVQRGGARRGLGLAAALVLLIGGYAYVIEGELQWRAPIREAAPTALLKESADGIDWQPWSRATVAAIRAEGRPVLVDFTADWCWNCQVNKRVALEVASVRAKLKETHTLALLGDYTLQPDDITAELRRYERAGVPLVLVFPKRSDQPAIVLPPALTPGIVLDALERASR